jgi:patatin-like phospholipase
VSDSSYSPRLRTGVVFCGSGTAGAYHAGVLRALTEAGVKVDVLAGHGAGAMTALCAAIDGAAGLWDPSGPWTTPRLRHAYGWRPALQVAAVGFLIAVLILLSPLLVMILAAMAYAAGVVAALVNFPTISEWFVGLYRGAIEGLFNPPVLPTAVPRAVVLALLVVVGVLITAAVRAARQEPGRKRIRGAFWWQVIGSPLSAEEPAGTLVDALWKLVRGASHEPRPAQAEIGRRYVDVLTDNFGQPGFREVLVGVHDLDARRDLVGSVLPPPARAAFEERRAAAGAREAEVVDFTGPQRELVVDFLIGALRPPIVVAPQPVHFPMESYWRGEIHRLCDRPELAFRLVDEVAGVGVEQVILVCPAPPPAQPHGMRGRPIDVRARIGELVRSIETAVLHDCATIAATRFSGVFVIRPGHNPIGPFDFAGVYDEASDRQRTARELIQQGYDDAYRQFIEPVVAAGERLEEL